MVTLRHFVAAVLSICLVACTSEDGTGDDDVSEDGYELLVKTDWRIPAGVEGGKYLCIRKTVEEDMYIGGFEAIASLGTHHTLVSAGNPVSPDGVFECGSFDHNFTSMIFESSTGTNRFELPAGVAAKVKAGQQINVNFHILNATDGEMTGTSGTRILRRDESEVEALATMIQMAGVTLELPPGESTVMGGRCTLPSNVTAFGVLPHMHVFGTHMKVIVKTGETGETVIHDEDFTFDGTKRLYPLEPSLEMTEGQVVEVYCTYNNTTGDMVYWGTDSYASEMCSAGVYLSPPDSLLTVCGS